MMKIILIGKNGQLGWEFQHILSALGDVILLGREELDISRLHTISSTLIDLQPDLIINAAAYTQVDLAETEIDTALKINALAPGIMAETTRKIGAVLIHYSTDYVFDGATNVPYKESDLTNPLNIYGKSKLAGERNIEQAGGSYLILRTSWVYSLRGNSFVKKVLQWARTNKTLKIVSDQIGSPTWTRSLAEITSSVIAKSKTNLFDIFQEKCGIYHLAGGGYTSRYEWARNILANDPNRMEQLTQTIEPVLSEEFPTPAIRPLFTALDCTKFEESFGAQLPGWDESLQIALTE